MLFYTIGESHAVGRLESQVRRQYHVTVSVGNGKTSRRALPGSSTMCDWIIGRSLGVLGQVWLAPRALEASGSILRPWLPGISAMRASTLKYRLRWCSVSTDRGAPSAWMPRSASSSRRSQKREARVRSTPMATGAAIGAPDRPGGGLVASPSAAGHQRRAALARNVAESEFRLERGCLRWRPAGTSDWPDPLPGPARQQGLYGISIHFAWRWVQEAWSW
jgi:hypothetical protein